MQMKPMNLRSFHWTAAPFLLLALSMLSSANIDAQTREGRKKKDSKAASADKGKPSKPNIVFILADDLGIGEVGAYGSDRNRTPVIDRLAKQGIRFTNGYTAPLCGPSRALILTGRYAFRTGAVNQDMCGDLKPSKEVMIPTVLKQAGYVSSMTGKWGQLPLHPSDFGFDDYLRFTGSGVYWSAEKRSAENYTVNGVVRKLGSRYMPDLMHEHAVEWMSMHRDKPFFLYYSLSHIHSKLQPTPDSRPGGDVYADNIAYMDKLVGKLLDALDSLGLRKNTLVVFMGDNGSAGGYAKTATIGGRPLSGKKGDMLEGGGLVPLIAHWPGVIAPEQVSSTLIDASDLLPTFAEAAGAPLPATNPLDGHSFLPQLTGRPGNPREWVFCELGNQWYVRDARWKLNRAGQLFDMSGAPFEEKQVADVAQNPEAKAARDRLQAVLARLDPASGILDNGDGTGRHAGRTNGAGRQED